MNISAWFAPGGAVTILCRDEFRVVPVVGACFVDSWNARNIIIILRGFNF